SGFMVDGVLVHPQLTGLPMLLTSHHVLPHDMSLSECSVVFEGMFDDNSDVVTTRINEIIWYSPTPELDMTLVLLSGVPGRVETLAVAPTMPNISEKVFV